MEEDTRRASARVCTTPCVAKTREKVKPMADSSTRTGMRPCRTSQPPTPYRASRDRCTAPLPDTAATWSLWGTPQGDSAALCLEPSNTDRLFGCAQVQKRRSRWSSRSLLASAAECCAAGRRGRKAAAWGWTIPVETLKVGLGSAKLDPTAQGLPHILPKALSFQRLSSKGPAAQNWLCAHQHTSIQVLCRPAGRAVMAMHLRHLPPCASTAHLTVVMELKVWLAMDTMAWLVALALCSAFFVWILYSAAVAAVDTITAASMGPSRQESAKSTSTCMGLFT